MTANLVIRSDKDSKRKRAVNFRRLATFSMYGFAPFPPPTKYAKLWKLYLAGSIAIDLGLFLGLLLYGGFALITVSDDASNYIKARQSRNWASATGTITSSGTVPEGKGFGVVANYTYFAEGQMFSGERIVFAARRPVVASEAEADQLLSPFGRLREKNEFSSVFEGIVPKRNRNVSVFYDPAAPEESTLRQEYFANPELGTLWPAIPISAFLIVILVASVKSWWRYITNREYESAEPFRLPA